VYAEERRELSLPAAAGGLKTMGYGRMATHRPGGVLPGGHSPSNDVLPFYLVGSRSLFGKDGHRDHRSSLIVSTGSLLELFW
jgi:hypothetical protein